MSLPSVSGSPSPPLREIYIAIRVDGADGSGTPDDPYNGATDERLDLLLRDEEKVPLGATIRFGPGIFQTKGTPHESTDPGSGWLAKFGQKFIGSGMDQTVLQLVKRFPMPGTTDDIGAASIFSGGDFGVNDVEISDMTLDCSLPDFENLPTKNLIVPCAMDVAGQNIIVKRVRVINFGTRTPLYIDGISQVAQGNSAKQRDGFHDQELTTDVEAVMFNA